MVRDAAMVLQWIDGRKRLLELIEPKIVGDTKIRLLVSRCRQSDSMLRKEVLAESLSIQSEQQAP